MIIDNYYRPFALKTLKGRYLNSKPVFLGTRFFKLPSHIFGWMPSMGPSMSYLTRQSTSCVVYSGTEPRDSKRSGSGS